MKTLTLKEASEKLSYDPISGLFTWKVNSGSRAKAGNVAGQFDPDNGYCRLYIKGRVYLAHRIAWLFVHGVMPTGEIDHRDRVKSHNWISNLRDCGRQQNGCNLPISIANTSGFTGVSLDRYGQWEAYINVCRKRIALGRFRNIEDAAIARRRGELQHFGEFARIQ